MNTMTTAVAGPVMATNGRGGSSVARTITNATITALTPTSVTVTTLGANVAVGDMLILGTQGIWGVCTGVSSNVASVKRWYSQLGLKGAVGSVTGSLIAYPGGVLRRASRTKLTGFATVAAATTITITDITGQVIASTIARLNTPINILGPWTVTLSATTNVSINFETFGDLDT